MLHKHLCVDHDSSTKHTQKAANELNQLLFFSILHEKNFRHFKTHSISSTSSSEIECSIPLKDSIYSLSLKVRVVTPQKHFV